MDYDAEFRQDAIDRTPEMFRRLCAALREYAALHSEAGLTPKEEGSSFRLSRGSFPTLFLQIQMQRGAINYTVTRRQNASGRDDRAAGIVVIVCTGQDHFYYRLDGEDIASEADLVQRLIKLPS
jgi:hypothetical protein